MNKKSLSHNIFYSIFALLFVMSAHAASTATSASAASAEANANTITKAELNKPAPQFELKNQDGKSIQLSQFKGQYIVLEWFNDGCPFIKKHYESHNMQNLQKEWTGKGVVWLSILSSAPGKQGHVTLEELKKIDKNWAPSRTHALFDGDGTVGKTYGASTTPHMFVISPKGELIYKGAIDDNSSSRAEVIPKSKNYVSLALSEHKAGKKVSHGETQPYGCSVKYKD